MGVPTVLSSNSGHRDLLDVTGEGAESGVWALRQQGTVRPTVHFRNTHGWGESSPDELAGTILEVARLHDADKVVPPSESPASARVRQRFTWARLLEAAVAPV